MHTFGRLHPVGIVHDVWDVILCAHSCQLFQSSRGQTGNQISDTHSLKGEVVTDDTLPVRHTRGKAGSCGVNTEDVLSSQLLDLLLHCLQVGPQLIALQDVLHHHRFKTWNVIKGCELECHRS